MCQASTYVHRTCDPVDKAESDTENARKKYILLFPNVNIGKQLKSVKF